MWFQSPCWYPEERRSRDALFALQYFPKFPFGIALLVIDFLNLRPKMIKNNESLVTRLDEIIDQLNQMASSQ